MLGLSAWVARALLVPRMVSVGTYALEAVIVRLALRLPLFAIQILILPTSGKACALPAPWVVFAIVLIYLQAPLVNVGTIALVAQQYLVQLAPMGRHVHCARWQSAALAPKANTANLLACLLRQDYVLQVIIALAAILLINRMYPYHRVLVLAPLASTVHLAPRPPLLVPLVLWHRA